MSFNPGLSEAEVFLASLHSSESSDEYKSDYWDAYNKNSPGSNSNSNSHSNSISNHFDPDGMWTEQNSGSLNLTPESFQEFPLQPQQQQQQQQRQQQQQQQQQQQRQQTATDSNTLHDDVVSSANHTTDDVYIKTDESPSFAFESGELQDFMKSEKSPGLDSLESHSFADSAHSKVMKPKRERVSHNVIEKKYRTNINDKILQLRDIIPTLRCAVKRATGEALTREDCVELDGLEVACKLNKASVLIKTIEYIRHLENKCTTLKFENSKLKTGQGFTTPESDRNVSSSANDFVANLPSDRSTQHGTPYAEAYPQKQEFSPSRYLMGGLALTMGASCFGDGNDLDNAKSLMSMPIMHYSPGSGLAFSNANGVISLQAAFLSILRLMMLLATGVYFIHILFEKYFGGKEKTHELPLVPFTDTVNFTDFSHVFETLKKTIVLNRLKYPVNSIERIESEIVNCFALKFYRFRFPLKIWSNRHIHSSWSKIKKQVELANLRNGGALKNGIEWGMITNVVTSSKLDTLDCEQLEEAIVEKGSFTLKEFIQFVNNFMVKYRSDAVVVSLLTELSSAEKSTNEVTEKVFESKVFNNTDLQTSTESLTVLNTLFEPTENNVNHLLKLVKQKMEMGVPVSDQILVLYSGIIRSLLSSGHVKQGCHWASNIPAKQIAAKDTSIIGVAAILLVLKSLFAAPQSEEWQENCLELDVLIGNVRIWLGNDSNSGLSLDAKGKLVDFCVDCALICGSRQLDEDTDVESPSEDLSDDELVRSDV
ncbi:LAFA_0G17546g1_1 [Lachancea sp. 'fantastica']|nr:LAFA_0G17546g1_1 [Lachancea sp. 'fantastica']